MLQRRKSTKLNEYQLKSLADLCFDLAKVVGASPIVKILQNNKLQFDKNDILLVVLTIVVFFFLLTIGLVIGKSVKEE